VGKGEPEKRLEKKVSPFPQKGKEGIPEKEGRV